MKPLFLSFSALFLSLCSLGQNPYLTINADSVVFYDYNYEHIPSDSLLYTEPDGYGLTTRHSIPERMWITRLRQVPIIINGKVDNTIEHSMKINKYHALQLTKMLGDTNSFGKPLATCEDDETTFQEFRGDSCYEPHLGIIYWWKGEPAAYISVSLRARVLVPNMVLPAQQSCKEKGISQSFIELISAIERYYNFPQ